MTGRERMKRAVGWMLIASLAFGPSAPIAAQEAGGKPKIDEEAVAKVLEAIDPEKAGVGRIEELERRNARTELLVERLAARMEEQAKLLEATNEMLHEFAKAKSSRDEARERVERAEAEAKSAIEEATPAVREKLGAALEASMPEHWTDDESAHEQGEKIKREMESAWREIESRQRRIEKSLATSCKDTVVAQEAKRALEPHVEGEVPQKWTVDLALAAHDAGVKLPPCFDKEYAEGKTLREAVTKLDNDRNAFEQTKDAIKSILTVIAEFGAVVITLLLLPIIFLVELFRGGSGGPGGAEPAPGPSQQGHGQGSEVRKTAPDTHPPRGASEDDGPKDEREGSGDGTGTVRISVEPGTGVTVEVFGGSFKLTDLATNAEWYADWPPETGDKQMQIPELDESMTITSADVVEKRITIKMTVSECGTDTPVEFELKANPDQPEKLEVIHIPNECVL